MRYFVLTMTYMAILAAPSQDAMSEPWLGTRYAQNCAGCHAPQRKNLPPPDRRCTLSCQGCHVNPNGGGLRSTYGKWVENRWLRSFASKALANKKPVAPYEQQNYRGKIPTAPATKNEPQALHHRTHQAPAGIAIAATTGSHRIAATQKQREPGPSGSGSSEEPAAPISAELLQRGFPLVELPYDTYPDEDLYLRNGNEFIILANREQFLYQIPEDDPYRLLGLTKFDGGADIRYIRIEPKDGQTRSFIMNADFGVRYRPYYRKLHIVYEGRLQNIRGEDDVEYLVTNSETRSLYAMVDDLPWNVFMMTGFYQPLFGNTTPDHTELANKMITFTQTGSLRAQSVLYNATSIGTAPNVPYLNAHYISRNVIPSGGIRDRGYAVNTGLKFVTLGASINGSYWRTDANNGDEDDIRTEMYHFGMSGQVGFATLHWDHYNLIRDTPGRDFREATVVAFNSYLRFWRENYLRVLYTFSNTDNTLLPGSATQWKFGLRSFLFSGLEWSIDYTKGEILADQTASKTEEDYWNGQIHLYF